MNTLDNLINTIQLGDCYELIKELPDKSIDLVYIDIPYEYEEGGHEEKKSEVAKSIKKTHYGSKLEQITKGINYNIFDELCRVMKNIYIYIWCSRNQILDIANYFDKKQCRINYLVWCKTDPTPMCNDMWLPDIEYCLCIKGKNAPRYNDGYELKSKFYISKKNRLDKDLYNHPTIKPLELVKRHILHSTQPGDVVLDCFCGSGTTCVACKETGRNYIGMEIDPEYHKIAVDRLNGITADGQTSIFTDFENIGE